MRKLVYITFYLIIASCALNNKEYEIVKIPDASKNHIEEVKVEVPEGEHVYKLKVEVDGEVTNKIKINDFDLGSGRIQETIKNGDYYGTEYTINYETSDSNEGNLQIKLSFYY